MTQNARRLINTHPTKPFVIRHQSVWYILNPKDGTQWRKKKTTVPRNKEIKDKHGNVVRTDTKLLTSYSLEKIRTPDGKKDLLVPHKNWRDVPPDAAQVALEGEFRNNNPDTNDVDLYYHGGFIKPLEEVHDHYQNLVTDAEMKERALRDVEARIAESEAKLAALEEKSRKLESAPKPAKETKPTAADSPSPPQPAVLRRSPNGDTVKVDPKDETKPSGGES